MDIYAEIADKLEVRKFEKIRGSKASGCISSGEGFHTENGDIFVKRNTSNYALPMFEGEFVSLQAIRATETIAAPKPLCVATDPAKSSLGGAIAIEYLDMAPVTEWTKFGSQLADLHLFNSVIEKKKAKQANWIGGQLPACSIDPEADGEPKIVIEKEIKLRVSDRVARETAYVEQFGFHLPTFCGSIEQNNEWHPDWIEFYARNKLDHQIRLLTAGDGDREVIELWSELQLILHRPFADMRRPVKPALLHGDLWSGNISQIIGEKEEEKNPIIFDPASFYGHHEFDLSIAILFGGFSTEFFAEYFRKIPQDRGFERRNELYKLFHTLNHWNHFGSHKQQTKNIMKKLIAN